MPTYLLRAFAADHVATCAYSEDELRGISDEDMTVLYYAVDGHRLNGTVGARNFSSKM